MAAIQDALERTRRTYNAAADHYDDEAEAGHLPLHNPDVWWTMVLGSGYRGTVDQLSVSDLARVRAANDRFIRDRGVRAVEANAVFAVAVKPA